MIDEKDVWLAQRGDKAAFTRLIKESQSSLYRVAKGILKYDSDCADALQEAITKGYLSIHTLRDAKIFKSWLTRIVINQCYDMIKKQKKVILMESVDQTSEILSDKRDYYELSEALDQLTEDHRLILTLFYYEQFSIQEIASIIGVKEGTVKSRLNRARNKLAELLNMTENERGEKHGYR